MSEKNTVAKYVSLAQELKLKVDSGEWKENSIIPTEREISVGYGVSRSTVRKSILLMTEEGYLRSEQGSGTFVMPNSSRESIHSLHSLSDDIASKGEIPSQQILEMVVITPSDFIRDKLSITSLDVKVQKIKRLRFAGSTPIGLHTAYLPLDGVHPITESELKDKNSLYKAISDKWSMKPVEAIESINARLPSPSESQLLEIAMNEALLTCNRVTLSSKFKPMEYVEMVYPSSRYDYKIRINRKSFKS